MSPFELLKCVQIEEVEKYNHTYWNWVSADMSRCRILRWMKNDICTFWFIVTSMDDCVDACVDANTLRFFENDSLFDESFNGYQVSSRDTLISTLVNYNLYSSKITHVT